MEVIKAKNGRPFSSRELAQKHLSEQELHPDIYGVYPASSDEPDKFVVAKHSEQVLFMEERLVAERAEAERKEREAAAVGGGVERPLEGEQYFFVMFHGRTDPQEAEHIEIAWQGDRITCRRESEICLPQRFLNVCDGAVQQLFEPTRRSENPYRKGGIIKRRAYTKIREGSREEFLSMLKQGNDITRRDMQLADRRSDD